MKNYTNTYTNITNSHRHPITFSYNILLYIVTRAYSSLPTRYPNTNATKITRITKSKFGDDAECCAVTPAGADVSCGLSTFLILRRFESV